ncbi:MAG: DUF222 domain-containing protein [Chloroflexi bacterium]|nr:MAG: DUF222 domain-containing protein [Chloroflexota bacterium]
MPKSFPGLSTASRAPSANGDHLLTGQTACSWVARTCAMSKNSAGDRLCLGEQLEEMPRVAESLSAGGIGYQAASVICHPQPHVGEIGARLDEEMWIDFARKFSIKDLSDIAARTWHEVDPEGFCRELEENFERRQLFISESGGMYRLDGWLDPEAGAALKSAIDALAKPLGSEDKRTPRQRRADALTELTYHALEAGTMPRRNRVRPHINVNTTIEGLKGELGAAASEMQNGMPVSSKTVQRLACDGTLSRVLKADSVVVDVGHATQAVSPAQWRALKARHRTCGFPECDRPINWTSPHHVEFYGRGGPTSLPNLLPLCHHHHRLVHEGDWEVVKAGEGFKFLPRRWGERAA